MLCSTCVPLLSVVDSRLNSEIGGGWDGAESCLRKWKIGRERFFTPTRVLGSPDEQWCEAGGAAATSKGKSGGRMAGEEKQEGRQGEEEEEERQR